PTLHPALHRRRSIPTARLSALTAEGKSPRGIPEWHAAAANHGSAALRGDLDEPRAAHPEPCHRLSVPRGLLGPAPGPQDVFLPGGLGVVRGAAVGAPCPRLAGQGGDPR